MVDVWRDLHPKSDHNALHLNIHLNGKQKSTTWRLKVSIINNKVGNEQIKMEMKRRIEENNTEDINPTILWDTVKVVIRGK